MSKSLLHPEMLPADLHHASEEYLRLGRHPACLPHCDDQARPSAPESREGRATVISGARPTPSLGRCTGERSRRVAGGGQAAVAPRHARRDILATPSARNHVRGGGTAREILCVDGVCCEQVSEPVVDGPGFGLMHTIEFQICYPEVLPHGPIGLVLLTHGSPETGGAGPFGGVANYDQLQQLLAKAGFVSAYLHDWGSSKDTRTVLLREGLGQIVWWLGREIYSPVDGLLEGHPLFGVNLTDLFVNSAFVGHSDGGEAAVRAASVPDGQQVRAVVGLATADVSDFPGPLNPDTYYLSIGGTHDTVGGAGPRLAAKSFDVVETDGVKALLLIRGARHSFLGPGGGDSGSLSGAYALGTLSPYAAVRTIRDYCVVAFLKWAVFDQDDGARALLLEKQNVIIVGSANGAPFLVSTDEYLLPAVLRFPRQRSREPSVFEAIEIFGGDHSDNNVEPISDTIVGNFFTVSRLSNFESVANIDIPTCNADDPVVPAVASDSGHIATYGTYVEWDLARGADAHAIIRFAIPQLELSSLSEIADELEKYSLTIELALHVREYINVVNQLEFGAPDWWPAIGLGDDSGPQKWLTPFRLWDSFGYQCAIRMQTEFDRRTTVLSSLSAPLSLLLPDGVSGVLYAYANLRSTFHEKGKALVGRVDIIRHG